MRRIIIAVLAGVTAWSTAALADPALRVDVRATGVRLVLEGSYSGTTYTVWRADSPSGPYLAITSANLLCMGECFAWDNEAIPGRTQYYRFDLMPPSGGLLSYGPYAVAIPMQPLAVRMSPNPSRGATRIDVTVPSDPGGVPTSATVRILDAQGRTIRTLHHGPVPRAGLALAWDGRDGLGRSASPGIYLVHVASGRGNAMARLIRIR
jgi:hypothetical protein